jgi:hypothetical protein
MDWYADSGATQHMSDQRFFFNTFKDVKPGSWKVNSFGTQLNVLGIASLAINSFVDGKKIERELCDVLYVPGLETYFFPSDSPPKEELKSTSPKTKPALQKAASRSCSAKE